MWELIYHRWQDRKVSNSRPSYTITSNGKLILYIASQNALLSSLAMLKCSSVYSLVAKRQSQKRILSTRAWSVCNWVKTSPIEKLTCSFEVAPAWSTERLLTLKTSRWSSLPQFLKPAKISKMKKQSSCKQSDAMNRSSRISNAQWH